jgi:predicted acetyltransferase
MDISIRQLQGDELLETLYALNSYALHPSPPYQNKEEWLENVRERQEKNCHALFENGEPVSVVVGTPMTQNMRGNLYPACGIWGVSTAPAARRKGYCRKAMASVLAAERDLGKVFSSLYPFRESFYERLGYVSYPLTKIAKIQTQSLSPLLKIDLGGEIKRQYIGEAYDAYRDYLADLRQNTHGMAMFDFGDQKRAAKNLLWIAWAQFNGSTEGLILYRITGEEVTKYNFVASRFYYKTSRARYLMLNWIACHIDQTDHGEIWLSNDEYPEMWLADIQLKVETAIRPAMSRVLDVEKIGGMSVGEGSFKARIVDPLCPWNEGCWSFESRGGKLIVSKAVEAECELTIQGLTALINGAHDPEDIPLRKWGNPDEELQVILRTMFPRIIPYMHEYF